MKRSGKAKTSGIAPAVSVLSGAIIALNSAMFSPAASAEAIKLDAIVVTGEKRDKGVKDTTTAVTVFTERELETAEVRQTKDMATKAPNVIHDTFGHIAIRGISGGGAATGGVALMTGSRARIATVVDGSAQDWSGYNFAPINLWDVEQLEVLRGPQSTTQGASAIGGAIVVNTKDPTFEPEAAVRLGLERYDNGNLKHNLAFMSSGGLIADELAYRIAADQTKGEGWLEYETSGFTGDLPNLSESESSNIRGKLLWEPTAVPELSGKLTVDYRRNEGEHANFASNTERGIATQTLTISDTGGALSRVQDSTESSVAFDMDYELKPGLSNSLHINRIDSDIYADGYGFASGTTTHSYDIEQTTTSLEDRLIFDGADAKLTGVLGLFAAYKESVIDATQGVIDIDTDYTTRTTALYGEGTYAFSPATRVTTGLRIEKEKTDKTGSFFSAIEADQDTDETYYLPKLALTHDLTDTTTLGAAISKGYSPSGTYINTNGDIFAFSSEEVTAYELSSKSTFGRGTTLNANLFYNDYSDYQALSGFTIVNVNSVRTYGLEMEAAHWVTDSLELRGSIGLLRSKIDRHDASPSYSGNRISSAPETNLGFGFTQYIGTQWQLSADITYADEYYSDLANTKNSMAGDYFVTDARMQYASGNWMLGGYIKNLTNEEIVYYRADALAAVGQDRSIGVNLTYRM